MYRKKDKVINDPVLGFILVEPELIMELLDSYTFQRLRRIRQLGTTFITYPGAEHTRFAHSLGVFFLGTKIITHLLNLPSNPFSHLYREEKERLTLLVKVASLLHDVGHGPLSHVFERIHAKNHEEWSRKIIMGDESCDEIYSILTGKNNSFDKDFAKDVVSILTNQYKDPVMGNLSCVNSIISGEMDADRLDYLQRDAYYTGVRSGFIDADRIIHSMDLYREEKNNSSGEKIVVWDKSFYNVEEFIFSRYYMYWKVYYHRTTRFLDLLLTNIIKRIQEIKNVSSELNMASKNLIDILETPEPTLAQWLRIDETDIFYSIKMWANYSRDKILRDLSDRFINRKIFKCIPEDLIIDRDITEGEKIGEVNSFLLSKGLEPEYYFLKDTASKVAYNFYTEENERIYIMDKFTSKPRAISELSDRVKLLAGKKTEKRYYVHPDYYNEVVKIFQRWGWDSGRK